MAKKKEIGAILTLRDNMSAVLRGVKKEQSSFRKDVTNTRKELEKTFKKKMEARLDATKAHKEMTKLKEKMAPFKKKILTALALKDMATRNINKTKNELKSLGRRVFSPVVKIKDNIKTVMPKIAKLTKAVGGIALAAGGAAIGAGIGMMKSGAELEKQQVSMGHFIGINNKGKSQKEVNKMRDDYLKKLRENSNATPFTASEVITAGTRALGVTGGNTKDAMELVKVAEDMAALTPGKTVQDAMEALADAKTGEMERLKEFNAKVSADEFKKLGFKGVVDQRLKTQFSGGAEKLSTTGAGMMSTIKGKLSSRAQDMGLSMLEKSKPMLQSIIKLLDSPSFTNFSKKMSDGVSFVFNKMGSFFGWVKSNLPGIVSFYSQKFGAIGGKFSWLGQKVDFFKEVFRTAWDGAAAVIQKVTPLIEPIWGIISSGCQIIFNAFQLAFPYIKTIVSSVWDFVAPIFDKLGEALGWVADKAGKIAGWLNKKVQESNQSRIQSVDGRHANGLRSVPFDGYIAELHKDEAVVPASQNPYTKNNVSKKSTSTSNNNVFYIYEASDAKEVAKEVVNELEKAALNM
jgi:hypothetical protein